MSHIDLPEPIWNALHARSKSQGASEGAVAMENGYIGLIYNGVHFKFSAEDYSAMRLTEFSKEKLEQIATSHDWKPLFVKGAVKRSRRTRR